MKKLLSILMLILPVMMWAEEAPEGYEYKPMVEEGRTWWYVGDDYDYQERVMKYIEHAIQLCGDTVIDGKTWKKCYLIGSDMKRNPIPFATMREKDKKIYTLLLDGFYKSNVYEVDLLSYCIEMLELQYGPSFREEMPVYDFNLNVGDEWCSIFYVGNIKEIEYVKYADSYFKSYKIECVLDKVEVAGELPAYYFFFPLHYLYDHVPTHEVYLRWITDADYNVIFEGLGGVKLWETGGVRDVSVAGSALCVARGELWVEGGAEASVTVCDLSGKAVLSAELAADARLSLSALPRGAYIASAMTAGGERCTGRFVR